tara:strand:- start:1032 stop:1841 length:810 start_codon:yes stop_codon:yes gene_type:complete
MIVKINSWYGRLGNNIHQVKNALHICFFYNANLLIPYHNYFNSTYIKLFDECDETEIVCDKSKKGENFYHAFYTLIDTEVFKKNHLNVLNVLKNVFSSKVTNSFSSNNVLTIHIRSGDIFIKKPHPKYIPPPLTYYKTIIDTYKFDKIIILSEDTKNPVIKQLLKNYNNCYYEKKTLKEDIDIILKSKNVVASIGSFISQLLLLSNNVENIFIPDYFFSLSVIYKYDIEFLNLLYKNCSLKKIDLPNYIDLMKEWKNTEEQQKFLINYI